MIRKRDGGALTAIQFPVRLRDELKKVGMPMKMSATALLELIAEEYLRKQKILK